MMQKLLLVYIFLLACGRAAPHPYPYRWVFVMNRLGAASDVDHIREIARVASEHGLNGMVLSAGLDRLGTQPAEVIERIQQVRKICDQYHLELIPQIFSAGYGGSVMSFDRNLAEGLPVSGALFVVSDGQARPVSDPPITIRNPSFEKYTVQEVEVKPHRVYVLRWRVKTEGVETAERFRVQVVGAAGRNLTPVNLHIPSTTDWREVRVGFNSMDSEKVRISIGTSGSTAGKFWIDDLAIQEAGLTNLVRRPGTPISVRDAKTGEIYEEGRDFAKLQDPQLDFRFDHEGPPIRLLPGSRIRPGARLLVDWYHGVSIHDGQVTVCMSEPRLYEIWREQARRLHQLLAPQKYLLSMDEIRLGGSDMACKQRHMSMAQILGECFRRQVTMLHELNPKAEIFTWSDMLDPNHNARNTYYLVDGDYTGSWNYAPRELRIVCWYYERRLKSLPFFSGLGFQTLAGAYYDGDTLENPKGWLEALDATPRALGIMYTTWKNKYGLLADFGDLVSRH